MPRSVVTGSPNRLPNQAHEPGGSVVIANNAKSQQQGGSGNQPSYGTNKTQVVSTPQGNVTIQYTGFGNGQGQVKFVPTSIAKNVTFSTTIAAGQPNVQSNAKATYTYALSNGALNPVLVGVTGTVAQNVVGASGGPTGSQSLGVLNYSPTAVNGAVSLGTPSFQPANVTYTYSNTYTNTYTGQSYKVGTTLQGTTSFNAATGLVSIANTSGQPATANLFLKPQTTNINVGGTPVAISYNIGISPTGAVTNLVGANIGGKTSSTFSISSPGQTVTYQVSPIGITPLSIIGSGTTTIGGLPIGAALSGSTAAGYGVTLGSGVSGIKFLSGSVPSGVPVSYSYVGSNYNPITGAFANLVTTYTGFTGGASTFKLINPSAGNLSLLGVSVGAGTLYGDVVNLSIKGGGIIASFASAPASYAGPHPALPNLPVKPIAFIVTTPAQFQGAAYTASNQQLANAGLYVSGPKLPASPASQIQSNIQTVLNAQVTASVPKFLIEAYQLSSPFVQQVESSVYTSARNVFTGAYAQGQAYSISNPNATITDKFAAVKNYEFNLASTAGLYAIPAVDGAGAVFLGAGYGIAGLVTLSTLFSETVATQTPNPSTISPRSLGTIVESFAGQTLAFGPLLLGTGIATKFLPGQAAKLIDVPNDAIQRNQIALGIEKPISDTDLFLRVSYNGRSATDKLSNPTALSILKQVSYVSIKGKNFAVLISGGKQISGTVDEGKLGIGIQASKASPTTTLQFYALDKGFNVKTPSKATFTQTIKTSDLITASTSNLGGKGQELFNAQGKATAPSGIPGYPGFLSVAQRLALPINGVEEFAKPSSDAVSFIVKDYRIIRGYPEAPFYPGRVLSGEIPQIYKGTGIGFEITSRNPESILPIARGPSALVNVGARLGSVSTEIVKADFAGRNVFGGLPTRTSFTQTISSHVERDTLFTGIVKRSTDYQNTVGGISFRTQERTFLGGDETVLGSRTYKAGAKISSPLEEAKAAPPPTKSIFATYRAKISFPNGEGNSRGPFSESATKSQQPGLPEGPLRISATASGSGVEVLDRLGIEKIQYTRLTGSTLAIPRQDEGGVKIFGKSSQGGPKAGSKILNGLLINAEIGKEVARGTSSSSTGEIKVLGTGETIATQRIFYEGIIVGSKGRVSGLIDILSKEPTQKTTVTEKFYSTGKPNVFSSINEGEKNLAITEGAIWQGPGVSGLLRNDLNSLGDKFGFRETEMFNHALKFYGAGEEEKLPLIEQPSKATASSEGKGEVIKIEPSGPQKGSAPYKGSGPYVNTGGGQQQILEPRQFETVPPGGKGIVVPPGPKFKYGFGNPPSGRAGPSVRYGVPVFRTTITPFTETIVAPKNAVGFVPLSAVKSIVGTNNASAFKLNFKNATANKSATKNATALKNSVEFAGSTAQKTATSLKLQNAVATAVAQDTAFKTLLKNATAFKTEQVNVPQNGTPPLVPSIPTPGGFLYPSLNKPKPKKTEKTPAPSVIRFSYVPDIYSREFGITQKDVRGSPAFYKKLGVFRPILSKKGRKR